MTELALMMLAAQLISNATPSAEAKYEHLSPEDQAKVESYIERQDQLPQVIEDMIEANKNRSNSHSRSDGMVPQGPTRETYSNR